MFSKIKQEPELPGLEELQRFGRIVDRLEASYQDTEARSIEEPIAYEVMERVVFPYAGALVKKVLATDTAMRGMLDTAASMSEDLRAMRAATPALPLLQETPAGKDGASLIAAERLEQVAKHGWDLSHDADYSTGELVQAAATCLSIYSAHPMASIIVDGHRNTHAMWPWQSSLGMKFYFKITVKSSVDKLKVAGAFIAAEIDRLQGTQPAAALPLQYKQERPASDGEFNPHFAWDRLWLDETGDRYYPARVYEGGNLLFNVPERANIKIARELLRRAAATPVATVGSEPGGVWILKNEADEIAGVFANEADAHDYIEYDRSSQAFPSPAERYWVGQFPIEKAPTHAV